MSKLKSEFTRAGGGRQVVVSLFSVLFVSGLFLSCEGAGEDYRTLIAAGEYSRAEKVIMEMLVQDTTLTSREHLDLRFELERMNRIRKDFTLSGGEVYDYVRREYPEVSSRELEAWEASRALEHLWIDGGKWYFHRAGRNLFRIDSTAREIWNRRHAGEEIVSGSGARLDLNRHNIRVIEAASTLGRSYVEPVRLRIRQAVVVEPEAVPAGEVLRCWIPFPREIPGRQEKITLLKTSPTVHIVADNERYLQRTIYMERVSEAGTGMRFEVEYEYTNHGMYVPVSADKVQAVPDDPALQASLGEEPPHIVFTPELRRLSRSIIGDETNPYLVARLLFQWVDDHIPWASAREYSTVRNIPMYAYENRHGDCGIQTLLFITLCRLNGIPARWQSGWEFQPPDDSMHDWGMIYFEPFGWMPMDVTYGQRDSKDLRLKWFYLQGMDSFRLIFNDAISQPFFPAKIHPRSETVDSQRGEVEWRGGNLYFDQWGWELDWEIVG